MSRSILFVFLLLLLVSSVVCRNRKQPKRGRTHGGKSGSPQKDNTSPDAPRQQQHKYWQWKCYWLRKFYLAKACNTRGRQFSNSYVCRYLRKMIALLRPKCYCPPGNSPTTTAATTEETTTPTEPATTEETTTPTDPTTTEETTTPTDPTTTEETTTPTQPTTTPDEDCVSLGGDCRNMPYCSSYGETLDSTLMCPDPSDICCVPMPGY